MSKDPYQEMDALRFAQAPYKEAPNMQVHLMRQIDRCLHASTFLEEEAFNSAVSSLLAILPRSIHQAVFNREEEWHLIKEEWQYQYWCGVPMGSPEEPITSDGLPLKRKRIIIATTEEGEEVEVEEEYEAWDKVVSPRRIEKEYVDYHELFRVIREELENANMIYSRKPETFVIYESLDPGKHDPKVDLDE